MPSKAESELQPDGTVAKAEFSQWIEIRKLLIDYVKHLATLDTASILVIVTFMDKFSTATKDRSYAVIALFFFMLSIAGVAMSELYIIYDSNQTMKQSKGESFQLRFSHNSLAGMAFMIMAAIGFIGGLFTLIAFAVINLST